MNASRLMQGQRCKFVAGMAMLIGVLLAGARVACADNWYVTTNGTGTGGADWANATNDIQTAIDLSSGGDTIWVSNGVYETGGISNHPIGYGLTNRVAIYKAVTVRSANNDPLNTIIKGAWDLATNGPAAVRCVYMTNSSTLIGFTLTQGATFNQDSGFSVGYGGGVFTHWGGTLSNCVIKGNAAMRGGGLAAYGNGFVYDSEISANTTYGNGGGGAYSAKLYKCIVISNYAVKGYGGGANGGKLYNCLLTGNRSDYGGGAYYADLYNCTVSSNTANGNGGGVRGCSLYNCIAYFNKANNWADNFSIFTNSCTAPAQTTWIAGDGNITNDPSFRNTESGRLPPAEHFALHQCRREWELDGDFSFRPGRAFPGGQGEREDMLEAPHPNPSPQGEGIPIPIAISI